MPGSGCGMGPAQADNRQTTLRPGISSRCLNDIERLSYKNRSEKHHTSPVGASLLAKAAAQSTLMCLTRPLREQARSHRFFCAGLCAAEIAALRNLVAVGVQQVEPGFLALTRRFQVVVLTGLELAVVQS